MFSIDNDLLWWRDQRVKQLHFGLYLTTRQYHATFSRHAFSGKGNISFLACHVTTFEFLVDFTSP